MKTQPAQSTRKCVTRKIDLRNRIEKIDIEIRNGPETTMIAQAEVLAALLVAAATVAEATVAAAATEVATGNPTTTVKVQAVGIEAQVQIIIRPIGADGRKVVITSKDTLIV